MCVIATCHSINPHGWANPPTHKALQFKGRDGGEGVGIVKCSGTTPSDGMLDRKIGRVSDGSCRFIQAAGKIQHCLFSFISFTPASLSPLKK